MRRRWILVLALGLGVPAAAVAGAYVYRVPLAELALENTLAERGVPAPHLSVVGIGLSRLEIADLSLGAQRELTVRRLDARYALGDLLAGRLTRIEVEGLRLALDLGGGRAPLGSLQPLFAGGVGGGTAPALPPIVLREARVNALTPLGALAVDFDGETRTEAGGATAAAIRFRAEGEPGRLRGKLDAAIAGDGRLRGTLVLDDGRLALPGGFAEGIAGKVDFAVRDGRPRRIEGRATIGTVSVRDLDLTDAHLDVGLTERRIVLDAGLGDTARHTTAKLRATLDDYASEPRLDLDAQAGLAAASGLWRLLGAPAPAEGRVTLSLAAHGRLPPIDLQARPAPADLLRLAAALEGHARLGLDHLAYPGRAAGLSGDVQVALRQEAGALALSLPADGRIEVAGLDRDWLRGLGVPEELAGELAHGGTLRLPAQAFEGRLARIERGARVTGAAKVSLDAGPAIEAEAGAKVRLELTVDGKIADLAIEDLDLAALGLPLPGGRLSTLRLAGALAGPPERIGGTLDLDAALSGVRAGRVSAGRTTLSLPLALRREGERVSLHLRAPGEALVESLAYGDQVSLTAPLTLSIRAADLALTRDAAGGLALDHAVRLVPGEVHARLARSGGPIDLDASATGLRLQGSLSGGAPYRGRAVVERGRLAVSEPPVAVEEIGATLVLGGGADQPLLDFSAGALRHTAKSPLVAPLALDGRVRRAKDALELGAEARWPDTPARITVSGRFQPDQGRGSLRIELPRLEFGPGALQPGALAPPLAPLKAVTGAAAARAEVAWGPKGPQGTAGLDLTGLSFEAPEARVAGLDLGLRLDRLFPPGSPPGQTVSVRRIDPGVPMENLTARFRVEPTEPPRLTIAEGQVVLLGGRVSVRDLRIDPSGPRQDVALRVESLDLAALFGALAIEGVTGEGRLSGTVPVVLTPATVRIQDARLEAEAPGVLHIRSAEAAKVLAGAGEQADLLLRALQNFHYDELVLTIARADQERAALTLSLLGKNPDVLEGYPFRLNFNLEANTGRILAAVGEAYRLSNRLLRRAWMSRR